MRTSSRVVVALVTLLVTCAKAATTPTTAPQCSLANAPSARLHIQLKGSNLQIHGQSDFEVFAKPVVSADGTTVLYDGLATFVQGNSRFNYTVVDGFGYVVESSTSDPTSVATQTGRCLSSITPFDSIVAGLNGLEPISSGSVGFKNKIDCSNGTLFGTSFGGENFVVCASGATGFVAHSGSVTMAVEYLDRPLSNISAPKLSAGSSPCAVVAGSMGVTPTTLALLLGEPTPTA